MSTILRRSPSTVGPTSMGAVTLPTANEIALLKLPGLAAMFDPFAGISGAGGALIWKDRKNDRLLTPFRGKAPTLTATPGNINGAAYMQYGTVGDGGELWDAANGNLWPAAASYSFVFLACAAVGDNAAIVGTGLAADYAYIQQASTGAWIVRHRATGPVLVNVAGTIGAPTLVTVSYDFAAKTMVIRTNGVERARNTAVAQEVLPGSSLHVGAASGEPAAVGGAQSAQYGGSNGVLGMLLPFSEALHLTANAADLALAEGCIAARYGLTLGT